MKKKIATMLIAALVISSISGCGSSGTTAETQPAAEEGTEEAEAAPEETASADDGEVYVIDIGDIYAPEHQFAVAMDNMAAELNEASGGRLQVTTFHNSTLGSEKEQVDAVAAGTLTMSVVGGGQVGALYAPMLVFDAPYLIQDSDHLKNVMTSEVGTEISDGLAEATKIRITGALYAGKRYVTTSNAPVTGPEDLAGLKIRVPDQELSIANFQAFGASPTPMAFSEVYLALQQGVVDGQENPLAQIMSAKFYEVQKYISSTCHVTQCVFLISNEDFMNSLPEDLRTLVNETAAKYCEEASAEIVAYEEDTLNELETTYEMTICEADQDAFKALSESVIAEYSSMWGEGLYERIQELAK